jgi:hypothetical protein
MTLWENEEEEDELHWSNMDYETMHPEVDTCNYEYDSCSQTDSVDTADNLCTGILVAQ